LAKLDEEAVSIIKSGQDNFELSMPGWSEEDIVYYGFSGLRVQGRFPDLLMENYRAELGAEAASLDVGSIVSKHAVFAEFANEALGKQRWSIKKALIGSVVVDGGLYAISEGEWYRLDQQFKSDIDSSFHGLVQTWAAVPLKMIKKVSGKKIGFESELEYNKRCAVSYGQICLDQEILQVPSVPYGKFEACDLLDIGNKRLIHVKKSSRQSSVLSHFFKQGGNSARILKTYPEAREALIKKVRDVADKAAADALKPCYSMRRAKTAALSRWFSAGARTDGSISRIATAWASGRPTPTMPYCSKTSCARITFMAPPWCGAGLTARRGRSSGARRTSSSASGWMGANSTSSRCQ
jgi:uncharacterized protein (TIGR04141 family)